MAVTFQFGTGSQGSARATAPALFPWAYTTAFRSKTASSTLARLSDIKSPLDMTTEVKYTCDKIANVYTTLAGGAIPVDNQASNVTGNTVFAELKTFVTYTGSDSLTKVLPIVSRLELRLPNSAELVESDIEKIVMATYAACCDVDGNPIVLTEKMRGALAPTGT